jgi:hypothetical protein
MPKVLEREQESSTNRNHGQIGNADPRVYFGLEYLRRIVYMDFLRDVSAGTLSMLIPIVAIICGIGYAITKAVIHHRERMAMIEQGMNPDAPQQK